MNRRKYICAISGGLSLGLVGCVGSDPPTDATPSENSPDVSISSPQNMLNYSARIIEPSLDNPENPFTLEVSVTNSSDTTITYGDVRDAFFRGSRSNNYMLYSGTGVEDTITYNESESAWELTDIPVWTTEFRTGELPEGESNTTELVLVKTSFNNDAANNSNPSQLQFENQIQISTPSQSQDWYTNILTITGRNF